MVVNVEEKAMNFAIKAFDGKVRKAEPEKDSVLHSIDVANKLRKYGFDENVISAGYLHDVVEDTDYTLEDIEREFGKDIASLVKGATEQNRNLSWEERKLATIKRIKNLDLRHKAVVVCDKISNSEDLLYLFGRQGKEDFSSFKRGREKKLWYWEEAYKSLIYNEDENLPMFKELKKNIENIFYQNKISKEPRTIIKYKNLELNKLFNIVKTKDNLTNIYITGDSKLYVRKIKKIIKEIISNKKIISENKNINIIHELINIELLYQNQKLPSDEYIELLDTYLNYIRDNIDKIIFIETKNNNQYIKPLKKIINMLHNNNVNIEIIDISTKSTSEVITEICNNILTLAREKKLNDIKQLIRKKKIG